MVVFYILSEGGAPNYVVCSLYKTFILECGGPNFITSFIVEFYIISLFQRVVLQII